MPGAHAGSTHAVCPQSVPGVIPVVLPGNARRRVKGHQLLTIGKVATDQLVHESNMRCGRRPALPAYDKHTMAEILLRQINIGDEQIDITRSYRPSSEDPYAHNSQG